MSGREAKRALKRRRIDEYGVKLERIKEAVDRVEEGSTNSRVCPLGKIAYRVEKRLLGIADVKELWC